MNDNKKMLQTRLNSIAYYGKEIGDLEEAIKVVKSVRSELVKSMDEFFPFYTDDIIMGNETIFKFNKLLDI